MESQQLYDNINVFKKDGFYVTADLFGTTAATAANYGIILVARYSIEVLQIIERHEVGASGAQLRILNVPNGTAPASGDSMLASTSFFDLNATANTNQIKQASDLNNFRIINQGDAIGLKTANALTGLTGVHVTIYFRNVGRGNYR